MINKEYSEKLKKYNDSEEWIHIDSELPKEDGLYETIHHQGSISVKLSAPIKTYFRNGKFSRMDWNYVLFWKKE